MKDHAEDTRIPVQRRQLRVLGGQAVDTVARESGVPAAELERWHRWFIAGGRDGLRATEHDGSGTRER